MAKYRPIPIRDIPEMIEMPIRMGLDKKRLKVLAMMAIMKSQVKRPIRIPELYKSKSSISYLEAEFARMDP